MAVGLPAGWLDTGVTATHVLSFKAEFRAQVYTGVAPQNELALDSLFLLAGVSLYTQPAAGAVSLGCAGLGIMQSYDFIDVILEYFPGGVFTQTILTTGAGNCTPGFLTGITIQKSFGPLRLGVTIDNGTTLRYAWFADASSVLSYTIGGIGVYTKTFADPPTQQAEPVFRFGHPGYSTFGGASGATSTFSHLKFSTFADNGGSLSYPTFEQTPAEASSISLSATPPYAYGRTFTETMDIDADETSGSAVAADVSFLGAHTCPAVFTVTQANYSWSGGTFGTEAIIQGATLADPWLSAQTVIPYTADRTFRFEGNAPKSPGNAAQTTWNTGSLTITSPLSVLRSTNAWTVLTGAVTIGGTPTVPTFTVTTAPSRVEKQLRSHWRDWNTAGALNVPGENYTATKRDAYPVDANVPDVWGWGLYSYLDVDLTTPALGAPQDLAFTVTWAVVTAGSGAGAIDTIERTYNATFTDGARSTQRLDLLFPAEFEGRPFHAARADSVRIVGMQVGTAYTLHSLSLVADQQAYLTLSGRSHVAASGTTVYTGAVLSQDGSCTPLHWSRDVLITPTGDLDGDGFTDYEGDHENGLLLVNALSPRHYGRVPALYAATLSDAFTELNRLEGLTATYSGAAIDTAFSDAFGNVIGLTSGVAAPVTRSALWFVPLKPHARITAGVAYTVLAQLVVSEVRIPCGVGTANLRIFQRNHLGMVLETVATDADGFRLGAGVTVKARAYTGGAAGPSDTLLATTTTDAGGFATLPIRTGLLGGSESHVYLTGS